MKSITACYIVDDLIADLDDRAGFDSISELDPEIMEELKKTWEEIILRHANEVGPMSERKDGGPAFPTDPAAYPGLSMLDWFAGMAMQGFCTADNFFDMPCEKLANIAYQQAAAMLAERERQ